MPMKIVYQKGAPVDMAVCQPLRVYFPSAEETLHGLSPEIGRRLLDETPADYVLPMSHYVRTCNIALRESPLYESGARIDFDRGGVAYSFYGHRYGNLIIEREGQS